MREKYLLSMDFVKIRIGVLCYQYGKKEERSVHGDGSPSPCTTMWTDKKEHRSFLS